MKGGLIDFVDFMNMLQYKLGDNETGEGISRVFQLMDSDGSGVLDKTDFKRVAKEIGEHVTDEAIEELIRDYYESNDGKVTVEQFYRMMIKSTF